MWLAHRNPASLLMQMLRVSASIHLLIKTVGVSLKIMLKHFSLALGLSVVCGLLPGNYLEVSAQEASLSDLTAALQNAICLNDWTTAIHVTNQMIGQDSVSSSDRHSYLQLRRQFEAYRAAQTVFDRSTHPQCQAVLQAANTPVVSTPNSGLNWDHATQGISQTPASNRPTATQTSVSRTVVEEEACYEIPEGDREVASGSISSRWGYDIIQEGRSNDFYLVYWPQNDCTAVEQTRTYTTQNEAYRAFRTWADEQAY